MSWTQQGLIEETRAQADAEGSARWSDTSIKRLLDTVYHREWSRILAAFPTYRWAEYTVVTDSNGRIPKSALSTDTARLHKILQMKQGDILIRPLGIHDQPFVGGSETVGTSDLHSLALHQYYFIGDEIQILPVQQAVSTTVAVSHIPKAISALASGDPITFPADYEIILAFEGAALMLSKGGAETEATRDLIQLARTMREDMLADISRPRFGPTEIGFNDMASDWGG
jgi:hypothetical protein